MWAIMCVCHNACHMQARSCLSTGWALNRCFAWFFGTVAVLAQGGGGVRGWGVVGSQPRVGDFVFQIGRGIYDRQSTRFCEISHALPTHVFWRWCSGRQVLLRCCLQLVFSSRQFCLPVSE